jgi:hypothetical protein
MIADKTNDKTNDKRNNGRKEGNNVSRISMT